MLSPATMLERRLGARAACVQRAVRPALSLCVLNSLSHCWPAVRAFATGDTVCPFNGFSVFALSPGHRVTPGRQQRGISPKDTTPSIQTRGAQIMERELGTRWKIVSSVEPFRSSV